MVAPSLEATAQPTTRLRKALLSRHTYILAAVAWLVALPVLTSRVARAYPVSSDDATGVLEAVAVLRGNVMLRGWWLSGVSFTTVDLPFYVAAVALWGQLPALLRDVPVGIYTAAVAVAAVLARGSRRRGGWPALGVTSVLVLLGIPAGGLAEFATKGYIRVGTTLGLLAALLALDAPSGRRASAPRVALFAVLLILTFLSDPYAFYVGAPALLVVCLLGALRVNSYETIRVGRIALTVLGATAAAKTLSWLIETAGGYQTLPHRLPDPLAFRDVLRCAIQSAAALAAHAPDLYRCSFPADFTVKSVALWAGCLIGPALLLYAFVWSCPIAIWRRHARPARPADFVADVLWFVLVLAVAGFLTNTMFKDRLTMRYMIPFVLSGAVLTGRSLANRVPGPRTIVVALVLLGLAYAMTVGDDLKKPLAADAAEYLANWLDGHDLHHGYGPFWDASIVTASGRGRIAVRPVLVRAVSSETHRIEPMRFMADHQWFSETPVTFVVYEPGPGADYQFGVDPVVLIRTFGPAIARHAVGRYEILVWDHDISPGLNRDSHYDIFVEWSRIHGKGAGANSR